MFKKATLLLISFLLAANTFSAAIVTTLHSFSPERYNSASETFTNIDGFNAVSALLLSSNVLYGTAFYGGLNDDGTIYRINADGTGFTNLHTFVGPDGDNPHAGLVLSGNTLYGTTSGVQNGVGSVFSIHTDGTGFTNLLYFGTPPMGYVPYFDDYAQAGMIFSSNMLYGTASGGGQSGAGAVFCVNTDGSGFTNIYSFSLTRPNPSGYYTNLDGADPEADLFLSGNVLYGTTWGGGTNGSGTVFRVNLDGTGFVSLHNFAAFTSSAPGASANADGAEPMSGVILYSNVLYGATYEGGANGRGVIYKINPDGTGFTNLFIFNNVIDSTNYGGANSYATLAASGGKLYGTTQQGGAHGGGTFFSIDANGVFTDVFDFSVTLPLVGSPWSGVIASGSIFYGASYGGGTNGTGTIYSLSFASPPVTLNAQISAGSLVINWTNSAFSLQAAPALSGPYATLTNAVPPYKITPTNQQQYFRLRSN
jgi:uncharacterized repeat protein (TIGR03803 family)